MKLTKPVMPYRGHAVGGHGVGVIDGVGSRLRLSGLNQGARLIIGETGKGVLTVSGGAMVAIEAVGATALHRLAITPFSLRRAAWNPARRELISPFGGTGSVALHEIVTASQVVVLAVRHPRAADYPPMRSVAQGAPRVRVARTLRAALLRPVVAVGARPVRQVRP